MPNSPDIAPDISPAFEVEKLSGAGAKRFDIAPDDTLRQQIAVEIGASAVRKLTFKGVLEPAGKKDWRLSGTLGATVVQPCVVTLAPVSSRIETPVTRIYLREMPVPDQGSEAEFDGDDETEQLESAISPARVMLEALVLHMPEYPRAKGAKLENAVYAAKDVAAMTDEDAKPFAGLAELRAKMQE